MKITNRKVQCILCGHLSDQNVVLGSSIQDGIDLDTRPSETRRSALKYSIQECPNCHYCAPDISQRISGIVVSSVKTNNYLKLIADTSVSSDAKKFILAAYLYTAANDNKKAAINMLSSAWIFDDLKEEENAIKARKRAIILLEKYLDNEEDINLAVMLLDLYRRSQDFSKCIDTAQELLRYGISDKTLNQVVEFEMLLAKKQDAACHRITECLGG